MEIKIKDQERLIDATLEVVDGVMIVILKEEMVDISKFKDGDVITCGHESYHWTCILRGEIERITDNMFIEDYCGINSDGTYYLESADSDSATYVRYATEEEKKALFDKIDQEGFTWDAEKKELVKKKWKPKNGDFFYFPLFSFGFEKFKVESKVFIGGSLSPFDKGWHFKTEEECQAFCDKLNQAINSIEP